MDNLPNVNPNQPSNLPTPTPQPPSSPKTKWWIAGGTLLGVIVILFAFYFFRSTLFPSAPKITEKQTPVPTPTAQRANPLFDTQSATVYGTITKITSSTVSITNNKDQGGDFPVSNKVLIYRYAEGSLETSASSSSDLKTVEIGKKATLFLELINGEYQVISISYFSSPPTPKQ